MLRNYDKGGTEVVGVNIYGEEKKALSLPGGAEGGYLELPSGNTLGTTEDITVSCWVNIASNSGYQRIWDFGNDTTSYFYLLT